MLCILHSVTSALSGLNSYEVFIEVPGSIDHNILRGLWQVTSHCSYTAHQVYVTMQQICGYINCIVYNRKFHCLRYSLTALQYYGSLCTYVFAGKLS